MEVKSCKRCRNLFQYVSGGPICPHCQKKEEEMFGKVKDYLRVRPGSQMQEIHEETAVPIYIIENFIRQGRLEVSSTSPIALPCERCGDPIRTGKYCKKCASLFTTELTEAADSMKSKVDESRKDNQARMRFFGESKLRRSYK